MTAVANRSARLLSLGLIFILVSACSWLGGPPASDSAPKRKLNPATIPDAVPRYEPITSRGNVSPYVVLGQRYELMTDYRNYRARGIASWYGTKFHGQLTSNGEIYDLYEMTAAHKTLPIPVYVKVTNLRNGRSAIVRVNDRGPFHDDRLIDLSYAAAVKLGFADQGTAPVEISVIDLDNKAPVVAQQRSGAVKPAPITPQYFLQMGAFRAEDSARRLQAELAGQYKLPVMVSLSEGAPAYHRVRVGPFTDFLEAERVRRNLQQNNYGLPPIVTVDGKP